MKKPAQDMTRRLEIVPLAEITPAPRNYKQHDVGALTGSVSRFGYVAPIVMDDRTGRIVAGHGRVETLRAMQADGQAPPDGVTLLPDGQWGVPVMRGWASRTDAEAEAYLVADNRLTVLGGEDEIELAQILKELAETGNLAGTGYDGDDLDALLKRLADEALAAGGGAQEDDAPPEPPAVADTKAGDLYIMGGHRLLCGDSTKLEDVARVMDGEVGVLMDTDPPYGIAYANEERPNPGVAKPRVAKPRVAGDEHLDGAKLQAFLESAIRVAVPHLRDDAAFYLWHPMLTQGTFFAAAAAAADILIHRQIIWVKPSMLLTRSGMYHWRHELCFYGWRRGNMPPWYGDKSQTSVWELDGVKRQEREGMWHATPKPVKLFEPPILNHSRQGEVVFEPFAGSGPQYVAAEQLARRCFGLEIEPRFCDVVVARWEKLTGKTAERVRNAG